MASEGAAFGRQRTRRFGIPAVAEPTLYSYRNVEALKASPHYRAAKAGEAEAARLLVEQMVQPKSIEEAQQRFGHDVLFVPVHAEEAAGRNKIPLALAHYYAAAVGAQVEDRIVQATRAFHTGARPLERIIARPAFDGPVEVGRRYVLVDDVTLIGNTLAELANHIRTDGGEVAGVVTLANAGRIAHIAVEPPRTRLLERRLGESVIIELGIEPGALTAAETEYLFGFRDAVALRNSIAKARRERSERLLSQGVRAPEAANGAGSTGGSFTSGGLSFVSGPAGHGPLYVPTGKAAAHGTASPAQLFAEVLVRAYRLTLSPLVGTNCRHLPTCSEYAEEAFARHGFWAGGWMTLARLLRCHPWGTAGLDFVPAAPPAGARWYMPWRYGRWRGTNTVPPR